MIKVKAIVADTALFEHYTVACDNLEQAKYDAKRFNTLSAHIDVELQKVSALSFLEELQRRKLMPMEEIRNDFAYIMN